MGHTYSATDLTSYLHYLGKQLWWFILNVIILNVRPARSAEAYETVWTEDGSPLLLHTRDQAEGLQVALRERYGDRVVVDFAMRYGEPSVAARIQALIEAGARKLLVLPLYPQYSGPTSGSTFDAVRTGGRALERSKTPGTLLSFSAQLPGQWARLAGSPGLKRSM